MPGEEMEITTDLGHPGFGEDIDIDLDFAVGQPDEDLELADFDQVHDIQNFNSDTRDELMAEGDDASYGMIDADDIDHNQAATTANDIEIDLGDPEENMWQQHASRDEPFENIAEIDYATDSLTTGEGNWLEAPANHDTASTDQVDVDLTEGEEAVATLTTDDNLLLESTVPGSGVESKDFGLSDVGKSGVETSVESVQDNASDSLVGGVYANDSETVLEVDVQQTAEKPATSEPNEYEDSTTKPNIDAGQDGNIHQTHDEVQILASHDDESSSGHDQGGDAAEQVQELGQEQEPNGSVNSKQSSPEEQFAEQEQIEQNHAVSHHNSPKQLEASDSYAELTNDQYSEDQGPTQGQSSASNAGESHSQSGTPVPGTEDFNGEVGVTEDESTQNGSHHVEELVSIATRHEMFISYGQTDYRLFAKSEDDDPNQYFLSDFSALDLPLGQFLSSLRDVISDEVSPLDELVMHVDGLGLEFSESSTSDMLEKYTFGEILNLYDRLVQNDGAESSPDLYTYLMVRPNCHQRLVALLDSADFGRGLSEVAVYREATPFDDEQAGEFDKKVPAISLDGDEEEDEEEEDGEEAYEDEPGHNSEKDDAVDSLVEREKEAGVNSVAELNTEEPIQHAEQSGEGTARGADAEAEDDLIDYSDDELDLSPTKQDHSTAASPYNYEHNAEDQNTDLNTNENNSSNEPIEPASVPVDAPNSDNTSVTATLNGDDRDEIDYSDDDGEDINGGDNDTSKEGPDVSENSKEPANDEITWESDNEDVENELTTASSKQTVQVSPGKRSRSDSDALDGANEQKDVKRRRS